MFASKATHYLVLQSGQKTKCSVRAYATALSTFREQLGNELKVCIGFINTCCIKESRLNTYIFKGYSQRWNMEN